MAPSDTIVLQALTGGWKDLGHVPQIPDKSPSIDIAEHAQKAARSRAVVRLHKEILTLWPESQAKIELSHLLDEPDRELTDRELLDSLFRWKQELGYQPLDELLIRRSGIRVEAYPDSSGYVLTRKIEADNDDGNDEASSTRPVLLKDHTQHVVEAVESSTAVIPNHYPEFSTAAAFHDHGKADIRFQALLRGGNLQVARIAPKLAKSGSIATSRKESDLQRKQSGLPDGFRHELLSLLFVPSTATDLTLHLIASHHGYCRSFAPFVEDCDPPDVVFEGTTLTKQLRKYNPAHHLGSGISERFWSLNRRFGWWGLAYYEAVFRLADWAASSAEVSEADSK